MKCNILHSNAMVRSMSFYSFSVFQKGMGGKCEDRTSFNPGNMPNAGLCSISSHAITPRVQQSTFVVHHHRAVPLHQCQGSLGSSILGCAAHWRRLIDAGHHTKVNEYPGVGAGLPHDVAGLEVPVHVACLVEVCNSLAHMPQYLHT